LTRFEILFLTCLDYPSRVAFNALQKVVLDFDGHNTMDSQQFYKVKTDYELNSKYLDGLQKIVELYQDPGKKKYFKLF
jgi:hypothetical protein